MGSNSRNQRTSTMYEPQRTILDTNTSIRTLQSPNGDLDAHLNRGFIPQSPTPKDDEEPQPIEQTKVVLKKIEKHGDPLSAPLSQSMDPTWRTLRSD